MSACELLRLSLSYGTPNPGELHWLPLHRRFNAGSRVVDHTCQLSNRERWIGHVAESVTCMLHACAPPANDEPKTR
jgi:hypothetical protein